MADLQPHPEQADVAGYLLGTLDSADSIAFASHLAGCAICQADLAELGDLPALLADLPAAEALPPGLEDRTFAAIEAAALSASPPHPEPDQTDAPAPPATITPIGPARARRQPPRWLALAAAVVVVAAGLGALISTRHRSPAPLATIRLISADRGPAHGTAVVRATPAGLTIDMTVQDLTPNRPGTMDTCWLVGPGDTLAHPNRVSVGSFVVTSPGATVHVHWTTAADLGRFPHLGVTLEPSNGNPSHQGPKVLVSA